MNKLPKNWQEYKLKDLCVINYGKGLGKSNIVNGNIPVYSSGGIIGFHNTYNVNSEGVIIGRKGNAGSVFYSDKPFFCIDTAFYIEPNNQYDLKYLFYKLVSMNLKNHKTGTAIPGLIRNDIYKLSISIPPLDEQKRIASALSKIDAYLENTIKLIEEKERFKRGIAKKLLTCKEGENIPEARFKGFEDKWEETQILEFVNNNIIKIEKGKSITKSKIEEGDIPVIAGGKTPPYYHNKYNYNFPCITISASGSAGYVWFHDYKIWASDCHVIYTDNKRYNIKFLYHYLKNIQDLIYYLQVGGVQKHVYAKDLIKLNIPNITIEEQEKIGGYLSLLDAEIDNLKKQKELIKEMKRGAMQKLLSGEVRLSKNAFNENI